MAAAYVFNPSEVDAQPTHRLNRATIGQAMKQMFAQADRRKKTEEMNAYEKAFAEIYNPAHDEWVRETIVDYCNCDSEEELQMLIRYTAGKLRKTVQVKSLRSGDTIRGSLTLDGWKNHLGYLMDIIVSRTHYAANRHLPGHVLALLQKLDASQTQTAEETAEEKAAEKTAIDVARAVIPDDLSAEDLLDEIRKAKLVRDHFPTYRQKCARLEERTRKLNDVFVEAHLAGLKASKTTPEEVQKRHAQKREKGRRERRSGHRHAGHHHGHGHNPQTHVSPYAFGFPSTAEAPMRMIPGGTAMGVLPNGVPVMYQVPVSYLPGQGNYLPREVYPSGVSYSAAAMKGVKNTKIKRGSSASVRSAPSSI